MSTRTRRWTIVGTVQYVSVLAGLAMAQDSSPIAQAARRAALNGRAAAAPSVVSPPSRPWAQAAQSGRAANSVKGRDAPQPTRPAEPASPPNPAELTVRPDERGMVRFNFHGLPWDDVLKWLADISDMSLDWQELPSDYLNLATKRSYTVAEARDLINRHLLARGYTLLQQGEVLSAVNLTNLDPAMVPRVTPEELARRSPHEFVKVSFSLDWLLAQEMALELEALCSPHGQLVPLTRTNRLEVIDAVVNLREIHRLLEQEQSADRQSRLVREFPLRYTRASQVREQLQAILGIQSMSLSPPASPQAMLTPLQQAAMRAQLLRQQRLRQQRAQPSRGASPIATISTAVTLVANPRRNSIFAHAPPDKMAIIASFIRLVDVPSQEPQPLQANLIRLRTYRLATIDPLILVDVLEDMGGLEPTTQLKVDQKHQAVIVHATAYDHMVIQSLVDKLDGSARRFEVIQLHRLAADEVAGTVEFMMGAGELAERSQPHRPANYTNPSLIAQHVPWTADHDRFRVSANVEQNQLLLWCNDVEFTEVENLMVKLGEIPTAGATASRIRVIDIPQGEQRAAFLEQLRRVWPTVAPNELLLPSTSRSRVRPLGDGERKRDTRRPPDSSPSSSATTQTIPPYVPRADLGPARSRSGDPVSHQVVPDSEVVSWPYAVKTIGQPALRIAQLPRGKYDLPSSADNALSPWAENGLDATSRAASARSLPTPLPQDESVATSPPVAITIAPDGRIVVTSQDTEALDRFQELTSQLLPPRKQFDIFYLQYAPAYLVSLKLEDFFPSRRRCGSGCGTVELGSWCSW